MPVADAEPLVGEWRRRHTPSGAEGLPAHVTLIVPFAEAEQLTEERLGKVEEVLGRFGPIDLVLDSCGYFLAVLYLEPKPAEPFRKMTAALVEAFPRAPAVRR